VSGSAAAAGPAAAFLTAAAHSGACKTPVTEREGRHLPLSWTTVAGGKCYVHTDWPLAVFQVHTWKTIYMYTYLVLQVLVMQSTAFECMNSFTPQTSCPSHLFSKEGVAAGTSCQLEQLCTSMHGRSHLMGAHLLIEEGVRC
jgi:hypothetical protein